jgi:large subunit ribosomal protein L29
VKTREFQELRKKDVEELQKLVDEKRTEVLNHRFALATGSLEDATQLGQAKRDVARLLTLIGEKNREVTA